ncbi:MAG TPA: DEDD exonuclease domain-containing protein [Candidatus Nanopelagicaceae bacterium]
MAAERETHHWQATFDEIGRPLSETTFVVLDLETTGSSPSSGAGITEIGAVKVRGGQVIGEFQTLVNPGGPIPAFITVLTGITQSMVTPAPRIEEVFPVLLEFLGPHQENVLVAHNAPFDIGFLKASAANQEYLWPKYQVIDTARLARQVLLRDEVINCKLGTLAQFFRTDTSPNHRALDDAKATVDVLHGLLERVGSFGVTTLDELKGFSTRITSAQREKKHFVSGVPDAPGVYIFRGPKNEPLYVGTSRNLRSRVRTYFTASETRKRIHEMIAVADHVDTIVCATVLEAQVRELRLINENRPQYNRRSKAQEKATWVKVVSKTAPRFSTIRGSKSITDSVNWIGLFSGKDEASLALKAIDRCLENPSDFDKNDVRLIVSQLTEEMSALALDEKFEEAAAIRNQLGSLVRGVSRGARIRALTRIPEIVAAQPISNNGLNSWEFVCIRHGRLAGSATSTAGVDISHTIASLVATAEIVPGGDSVLPASTYEEVEKLLSFLEAEGVRLVSLEGEWSSPVFGAGSARYELEKLRNRDQEAANFWVSSIQRSSR